MYIEKGTKMLLLRYNNYRKTNFLEEHMKVLEENGYVWMLKIGKKTSIEKIQAVLKDGGTLILRAPKADGAQSYYTQFVEFKDSQPDDFAFPEYYDSIFEEDGISVDLSNEQWFKVKLIKKMDESNVEKLILEKTGKKVNDVIGTTRTAVMYITCEDEIKL